VARVYGLIRSTNVLPAMANGAQKVTVEKETAKDLKTYRRSSNSY
jgi:hypothetical protein